MRQLPKKITPQGGVQNHVTYSVLQEEGVPDNQESYREEIHALHHIKNCFKFISQICTAEG